MNDHPDLFPQEWDDHDDDMGEGVFPAGRGSGGEPGEGSGRGRRGWSGRRRPLLPPRESSTMGDRSVFEDPSVVSQMVEMSSVVGWLGYRWCDIPVRFQRVAWEELRRWVDRIVVEWQVSRGEVPDCWFRHPRLVQELYACMNAEYKAWEEKAPTVNGLLVWSAHFEQARRRMREVTEDLAGCARGVHQEETARRVAYEEGLWAETVGVVGVGVRVPRPEKEPVYVRGVVRDPVSGEVRVSEVVGVSPAGSVGVGGVELVPDGVPDSGVVEFRVRASGGEPVCEQASDPEGPWEDVPGVS